MCLKQRGPENTCPQGEFVSVTEDRGALLCNRSVCAVAEDTGEHVYVTEEKGEFVSITEERGEHVCVTEKKGEDVSVIIQTRQSDTLFFLLCPS